MTTPMNGPEQGQPPLSGPPQPPVQPAGEPPLTNSPVPPMPGGAVPTSGGVPTQPPFATDAAALPPTGAPQPVTGFPVGHDAASGSPTPATEEERVGRGLAVAVGAVLVGMVISALLGAGGRLGGLGAWAASAGAVMGYVWAASGFRKGKFPVLGLMIVGTVLCIYAALFGAFMRAYNQEFGAEGNLGEAIPLFFQYVGEPDAWKMSSLAMLIILAIVGFVFGLWRWIKFAAAYRAAR